MKKSLYYLPPERSPRKPSCTLILPLMHRLQSIFYFFYQGLEHTTELAIPFNSLAVKYLLLTFHSSSTS